MSFLGDRGDVKMETHFEAYIYFKALFQRKAGEPLFSDR